MDWRETIETRKIIIAALFGLALLITGAIVVANTQGVDNPNNEQKYAPSSQSKGLTPHAPIYIDGNAGFTKPDPVNGGGMGTEIDPYIIENWDINASSANGIKIRNTDKYFIIRNCAVHGGGVNWEGIYFYNVLNGNIENCVISNNLHGIYLRETKNSTIINTNVSYNNGKGIVLYSNSNRTIMKNISIYGNAQTGIDLSGSSYNNISNSFIINNTGIGIDFGGATIENDIYNTEVKGNEGTGIDLRGASYVDIVDCNISMNKGNGGIYSGSAVTNINITNTEVWNNLAGNGIDFYGATWVNIMDSKVIGNFGDGIYLYGANSFEYNTVSNNEIISNGGNGIHFNAPYGTSGTFTNNDIYGNIIKFNTGRGIYFYDYQWYGGALGNNNIYKNTITLSGDHGIYFQVYHQEHADYNNIFDNTISNNSGAGVYFYNSYNSYSNFNTIYNNTIEFNSQHGVYFYVDGDGAYSNSIHHNAISFNNGDGVRVASNPTWVEVAQLTDYSIYSNNISYNDGDGIHLSGSASHWPGLNVDGNTIYGNTIFSNNRGVYFSNSNSNTLSNSNTSNNRHDGILLSSSTSNTLRYNTISNNNWTGINLTSSSNNNVIKNNNITSNNQTGISITDNSNYNTLTHNTITNNIDYGISIINSDSNSIYHNNLISNRGGGTPQAYDNKGTNYWYNTATNKGSYWSDWTAPDADHDGIVDSPYLLGGGAGAKDFYPLVNIADVIPPTSFVNPISPYWQLAIPFTIAATAYDESSDISNVSLYYRTSWNNATWGDLVLFDTDTNEPWSWSFTAPNGMAYYQFYSIATDISDNVEPTPVVADSECKYTPTGHISRPPIYIDSNSQFTTENGVSNPEVAGTVDDPYIIENWDIDASTATGISVQNTDVYFIIRNCVIRDGKNTYYYGIYFYNVQNGKIENVTSYNNYAGILLGYSSNNNIITNCAVYNNDFGIVLWDSSNNNEITNCDVYNNSWHGIRLYDSSNNVIYNNYFNNTNNVDIYGGSGNKWNISKTLGTNIIGGHYLGGNYWSDYAGADADNDSLGDVNVPYGPGDYLPLTAQNFKPIANFIYSPEPPKDFDIIQFTSTSTDADNDALTFFWSFGDGNTSTQNSTQAYRNVAGGDIQSTTSTLENPTHQYRANGTYTVTLTVTDVYGASNTTSRQITVLDSIDYDGDGIPNDAEVGLGLDPTNSSDALLDPDSDGWDNLHEYLYGTNMHNWDTDVDGLSDAFEVIFSKTNPLVGDTDGNGVSDGIDFWRNQEYSGSMQILPNGWIGMTIACANYTMYAETNSSVLEGRYDKDKKTLRIKIHGPPETTGVANITIPKDMVGSEEDIKIQLDGHLINYTLSQNATHYFIHIEYTHSTHELAARFTPVSGIALNNPVNPTKDSLTLSWDACISPEFAKYEIYQSTVSGTLGSLIATITDPNTVSYTITGLSQDTIYYFTVRVVYTDGFYADADYVLVLIAEGKNVNVVYNGTGNLSVGNVSATKIEFLKEKIPSGKKHIGVFVNVTKIGEVGYANITIRYNDSDIVGIDPATLIMYYWNETSSKWESCANIGTTGVDTINKIVWANVTHLTIFAPMAEKIAEQKAAPVSLLSYIIIFAVAVVLVITGIGVKKRTKKEKTMTVRCPKCGETSQVASAERPLSIVCPKCGTKGTLK